MKKIIQAIVNHFYLILKRVRLKFDWEEQEGAKFLCGKEGCLLWKKNGVDWDLEDKVD